MNQRKGGNDCRNYFMINLHESMGPGRDRTRDPSGIDYESNVFALCTNVKVYLYNYSKWVELSMNIHKGNG